MAATVREERVRRWSSSVPSTSEQNSVMCWGEPSLETELARALGRAVAQELRAACLLVALADGTGGAGERRERPQEAPVGLVRPRHRALPAPARLAQRVERPVVAGAGVRVGLDVAVTVGERVLGEHRPRERARGEGGGHLHGVDAGVELLGGRVDGETRLGDAQEVVAHEWVPAERSAVQASTMRTAMASSAALPQARGSYCFLLPTSPSTLRTPA